MNSLPRPPVAAPATPYQINTDMFFPPPPKPPIPQQLIPPTVVTPLPSAPLTGQQITAPVLDALVPESISSAPNIVPTVRTSDSPLTLPLPLRPLPKPKARRNRRLTGGYEVGSIWKKKKAKKAKKASLLRHRFRLHPTLVPDDSDSEGSPQMVLGPPTQPPATQLPATRLPATRLPPLDSESDDDIFAGRLAPEAIDATLTEEYATNDTTDGLFFRTTSKSTPPKQLMLLNSTAANTHFAEIINGLSDKIQIYRLIIKE